MLRLLPFTVLAASIAHAAPATKSKDVVYHPTKLGDTRVYESSSGGKAETGYTDTVTDVEQKEGVLYVTNTCRSARTGAVSNITTVALSDEGLFRFAEFGAPTAKELLLKMPAKVGAKWEVDGVGKYTITKEEEIEVPAGKFRAICVEWVTRQHKTTLWFAPNVGLIKWASTEGDRVKVIKEFKPGK